MVRFDRAAPGEGMILYRRVENGKAYLEFQFFLKQSMVLQQQNNIACIESVQREIEKNIVLTDYLVHIRVYDMSDRLALEMDYPLQEEELAKGMLLHPHLWKGISDPYLYSVKADLLDKEKPNNVLDTLEKQLPLCTLQKNPKNGWLLNGNPFAIYPVVYNLPAQITGGMTRQEKIEADLHLLKGMGANTICISKVEFDEDFIRLCDEMGMLVWCFTEPTQIPALNELLSSESLVPTDSYYYYKACWSSEPFVYLVSSSLKRQENGNYTLTVYSNQKKVALYVEGVLFEFQMGAPTFLFEEIHAKKYPLQLTAEAGECRVSLTVY